MHGRTFEFSNKAKLHVSFEGNLFSMSQPEIFAMLELLELLLKFSELVERLEEKDVQETPS